MSTLEEHSIDIQSIFWYLLMVSLFWQANEVKADGVYWNSVLACKILQNSSNESICEEEATEPEFHRWAIVHLTFAACSASVALREQESGLRGARRSTWVERIAVRSWFPSWLSFVISAFWSTKIKKMD